MEASSDRRRPSREKLLAIHRSAAAKNTTTKEYNATQRQEQLARLRHRRIALAAELAEMRSRTKAKASTTLYQEINQQRKQPQDTEETSSPSSFLDEAIQQEQVAVTMRRLRQRKCLDVAYRLAGISMFRVPDKDILALRFDTISKGCHHCFFDIIEQKNDEDGKTYYYLRLVQHTLPLGVPLNEILYRHLGGLAKIGEATTTAETTLISLETNDLLERLRACANQIYHACHCLAVRNETYQYLQSLTNSNHDKQHGFTLDHLEKRHNYYNNDGSSHSSLQLSFHLHHDLSGIGAAVRVKLQYSADLCRRTAQQPAFVSVKVIGEDSKQRRRGMVFAGTTTNDVLSGNDDNDEHDETTHEFVENAVLAFRRLDIRTAMQQVVEAMAEW